MSPQFIDFETLSCIGRGTFGRVFKAKRRGSNQLIALKVLSSSSSDNDDKWTLEAAQREFTTLRQLQHRNILQIFSVQIEDNQVLISLELCRIDLFDFLALNGHKLTHEHMKSCIVQLLRAVAHCHSNGLIHRDIKPHNILLQTNGVLKLADFGLSRKTKLNVEMTKPMVTLNYRAPELLLGEVYYDTSVDIWSVGCTIAEITRRGEPMFECETEIELIRQIWLTCGTPTKENWPNAESLPEYGATKLKDTVIEEGVPLKALFEGFAQPTHIATLMSALLRLNPQARLTAKDALRHAFLHSSPLPCSTQTFSKDFF